MKLKFEELFSDALGALVSECGGSIETALDEMYVRDIETRDAIRKWFGWDDEEYDEEDEEDE